MSHTKTHTDFDSVLEALGSRGRRQILVSLFEERAGPEPERVDEFDFARDPDHLLRFHHVDLPKLDEMGYVSWDRETGEVDEGSQFGDVRPVLDLLVRHEDELPDDWL